MTNKDNNTFWQIIYANYTYDDIARLGYLAERAMKITDEV